MSFPGAPAPFRRDDLRVSQGVIAFSASVRAVFALLLLRSGPMWLVAIQLLGMLVYLLSWRRRADRRHTRTFILLLGPEWVLWCYAMIAGFGVAPGFQRYGLLLLSTVLLLFPGFDLRFRASLIVLPLFVYWPMMAVNELLEPAVTLSPRELFWLGVANDVVVTSAVLAIVVAAMLEQGRARRLAELRAETQTRLVEDMSHELRTPVATILTASQGARSPTLTREQVNRAVQLVEADARSVSRLVTRMLELAELDGERTEVVHTTALSSVVQAEVEQARRAAPGREVDIVLEGPSVAELTDPVSVGVVLRNLIGNAVHHSPTGATIRVRSFATAESFGVEVADEGAGIAPEHLPFVFDRYWRADPSRSRREGRHGLGLAISQRHAALLGATLDVRSRLGEGSVFRLSWKREQE